MLDVRKSPELQAAILSMRAAEREIRLDINKEARKRMKPIWAEALRGNVTTRLQTRVILPGARVAVGARNISVKAAMQTKPLRGGLVPSINWAPVEFGARERSRTFESTSSKGKKFKRTMIVGRQFAARTKVGQVAYNAASETGTALVGIWVRTIVDKFSGRYFDVTGR